MKIKRIKAENYKTYRSLDLNLEVTDDRPIILIGGANGCGKTTLFDAIYHALYGLKIKNAKEFEELFNAGVLLESGMEGKRIVLEIEFSGMVLSTEQQYSLQRSYLLFDQRVMESVTLKMGGATYHYGSETRASERAANEEIVNKILAANLPAAMSNYFLFDAMKTSELVKEESINRLIQNNINMVMGFNKYHQLQEESEALLAEKKAERLENENQRKEYQGLVKEKGLIYIIMVIDMKANGLKDLNMEKENFFMWTEVNIWVIMPMEKKMEKGNIYHQKEINILEILKMTKKKEKEYFFIQMVINMREILIMIILMARVNIHMQMEIYMKVILKMTYFVVKVLFISLMVKSM